VRQADYYSLENSTTKSFPLSWVIQSHSILLDYSFENSTTKSFPLSSVAQNHPILPVVFVVTQAEHHPESSSTRKTLSSWVIQRHLALPAASVVLAKMVAMAY
jgi:hypothetical protein